MTDYYIIGSGGFAKEVFQLASAVFGSEKRFGGFIDIKPNENQINVGSQIFDLIDEVDFLNRDQQFDKIEIFFGIGNPSVLDKCAVKYKNFRKPNLIHPDSKVDLNYVKLGEGNIIAAGCIFTLDIQIGSFNVFNLNCTVGHDSVIGDCNVVNPGCNLSGGLVIGNSNLIGTNATILQYLSVGDNNVVGASSLVHRAIDNLSMIVGVPGKKIKDL